MSDLSPDWPDLARLQELLRESKATNERSQTMLDDPEGADLIRKAEGMLETGIRQGRRDIADQAAAVLQNLLEKEADLRQSMDESRVAQAQGRAVLQDELHRRNRP